MIKFKIILLIIVLVNTEITYSQFTEDDIVITVNGLSEEIKMKFKENKSVLAEALNRYNLPSSIKPIKILVDYTDKIGSVSMMINFNLYSVYKENSIYLDHGKTFSSFGKGISFYFQNNLFLALSEYKYYAAKDGFTINKEIARFKSNLILTKENNDYIIIKAFNSLNTTSYSKGVYPHYFKSNVNIQINKKKYKAKCSNLKTLNDYKFFYIGDIIGLDGERTGAYYFCKFFEIETD